LQCYVHGRPFWLCGIGDLYAAKLVAESLSRDGIVHGSLDLARGSGWTCTTPPAVNLKRPVPRKVPVEEEDDAELYAPPPPAVNRKRTSARNALPEEEDMSA
jgi:hypothetical protein